MEFRGKIVEINLDTQIAKQGGGTYPGASISYRDASGKLQEKGFHANVLKYNAALKNGLDNLKAGDSFVAPAEKNEKGYWEWKSIAKDTGDSAPPTTSKPTSSAVVNSTYATKEERAQTQAYIVRQSSITAALKLLELHGNKKATTREVISLAQEFEAYVFNQAPKELTNLGSLEDIDDDIPF